MSETWIRKENDYIEIRKENECDLYAKGEWVKLGSADKWDWDLRKKWDFKWKGMRETLKNEWDFFYYWVKTKTVSTVKLFME